MKASIKKILAEAFFSPKPENRFAIMIRQLVLVCMFGPFVVGIVASAVKYYNQGMRLIAFNNQVDVMAHAVDPIVQHHLATASHFRSEMADFTGDSKHPQINRMMDVWGFPLIIEPATGTGKLRLISYGKDGVAGGIGENADWEIEFDFSDGAIVTVISTPAGQSWHLSHKLHLTLIPTGRWEMLEERNSPHSDPKTLFRLNLSTLKEATDGGDAE